MGEGCAINGTALTFQRTLRHFIFAINMRVNNYGLDRSARISWVIYMSAGSSKGQKSLAVDVEHAVSFISFCADQRVRLTRQASEAPVATWPVMSGDEGYLAEPPRT